MSGGKRSAALDFASDNVVGASEPVLAALLEAGRAGPEGTYGGDRWSRAARDALSEIFERPVTALFVATGTAANALALQGLAPPGGGVLCHAAAHVIDDECGAPEFFIGGGKLVGIPGEGGKITPPALREALARFPPGVVRQVPAAALSLSQATECGTVYTPAEIAALTAIGRTAGLPVHMDGARFANALVEVGCTPAEMTWKAGVDVLSFGATKNGALACEAVVFFDARAPFGPEVARKRGGHTVSKGRLLGAQMQAYLADGHWLSLARQANAMAARLAEGLGRLGLSVPWPRGANEVFVILPGRVHEALQAAGGHYYLWETDHVAPDARPREGEVFARLICSFATTAAEVDGFLAVAARAAAER